MESTQFHNLLLLLRKDLQNEDIPYRTTIRKRILQFKEEHLKSLSTLIKVNHFLLFKFYLTLFLEWFHGKSLLYHGHVVRPR